MNEFFCSASLSVLALVLCTDVRHAEAADTHHAKQDAKQDIVDTAIGAGQFTTLVTAVKAAGLVDVLKSDGPLTVFAPTDEAFAKIPERQLQALLKDQEALKGVLTYHVVPGKVMAADVANLSSADTVQGKPVRVIIEGETVMINNSKVIKTDIECSNGVIHVLDTVLLPTK